jgi:hypothetical protein
MPPKHPKPPNHPIKSADRLALAITGLKTGKYTTIHDAATQNAVPESTLRARVKSAGFPRRANTRNTRRRVKEFRLTRTEENTLSNWIVQVHEGGNPIYPRLIQDMADTLLEKRGGTHGFRVTREWVSGYIQFHPEFAALIEQHNEYLEKELGMRPFRLGPDPDNPKDVLEYAVDGLHNTAQFAKQMNEFEKTMQKDLRERMVTKGPDHVRTIAAALEEWRQEVAKVLESGVEQCSELGELLLNYELDTSAFVNGYRELLCINRDTEEVQEEMRVEFGGKVAVEEES